MWKKVAKSFFLSLSLIGLIFLNYNYWQIKILTVVFFVLFIAEQIFVWKRIWQHWLSYNKKLLFSYLWSLFSVIFLLGTFISWWIIFYRLTIYSYFWIFLLFITVTTFIDLLAFKYRVEKDDRIFTLGWNLKIFNRNFVLLASFFLVLLVDFYLLFKNQSGLVLFSPWQIISNYCLPLFFLLQIFVGYFVFSKYKTQFVLFVLVLTSLLLHLYLPFSHQMPWGGDVWRHLATENKINNGDYILPVLFGDQATWKEIAKVNLPEVFQSPQKYSYAFTWGITILFSKFLNFSLLDVNRMLGPILFSLMLPILLYRLGFLIFDDRRKGLLLAWLASLPFALQASGSLTLPVNLGLLAFLFVLILWFEYLRSEKSVHKYLALFFAFLLLFNYSLYFILIWMVIIVSCIIYHISCIKNRPIFNIKYSIFSKAIWTTIIFLSFFIIPIIELVSKVSYVPENLNFWQNVKQVLGQFSGWFFALQIRSHDILSGNIIFNQTPDYAFVANIFNNWRWWLVPVMIILWLLIALGLIRMCDIKHRVLGLLFSTVFGGYLIGWFVLDGDRLLTRRLDSVLAVLILVLMLQGLFYLLSRVTYNLKPITFKIFVVLFIIFFSWFITFTYASGPDMRVVSVDEYNVAKYVEINRDKEIGNKSNCVLADTWVLLPLESLSFGQIVGGGFPIDYQFAQPERTVLFSEMEKDPRESVLTLSHEKTGAEKCWYVEVKSQKSKVKSSNLFDLEPAEFGNLDVWKETSTTTSTVEIKPLKKGRK